MFFCKLLACESCSCVPTEIESRFGFSSKIGMFSSNSGRFDTLLGFLGGTGACSPGKKIENWGLPNCRLSILTPPIYFCYLCSFKFFTVPLSGPFFALFFGGGGGVVRSGLGQHDMTATSEVWPVISLLWTDVTLLTDGQPFLSAL